MNTKHIVTALLGCFVVASVVVLAAKELRQPAGAGTESDAATGTKLIVYYLHGDVRCATCESIESYAKEAVDTGFAEQLRDGRIEWRVVNYEEPGNEHFVAKYDLVAPCVVLSNVQDGKEAKWRSLPEVWEHVGDKPAFLAFVKENIEQALKEAAPTL